MEKHRTALYCCFGKKKEGGRNSIRTGLISPSPQSMSSGLSSERDRVRHSPGVKGKLMPDVRHLYKSRIITAYLLLQFKCPPDQLPQSLKFKLLPTHRNPGILLKEKNSCDLLCKAFILVLQQKRAWNGDESKRHFPFMLWM